MKQTITFIIAGLLVAIFAQPVSSQSFTNDELHGITTGITIGANTQKVPFTGTYYNDSKSGLLYNNGSMVNVPGAGGSPDTSRLQTALGMTSFGAGAQKTSSTDNRVAEDLVITDSAWVIDSIIVYFYQTGSSTSSTMTAVNLQVWNGDPSVAASTVHWGNPTSNVLDQSYWSMIYRDSDDSTGIGLTNRPVMACNLTTPGLILSPGTWWIDYQGIGSLTSGPWVPPITIDGLTTTGNAKQKTSTGWANLLDGGTSTQQGLPFKIYGNIVPNTGIAKAEATTGMKLYPNPANDALSVESTGKITLVELYNSTGQLVLRNNPDTSRTTLDISSLNSGVYFISVYFDNTITTRKLIVK